MFNSLIDCRRMKLRPLFSFALTLFTCALVCAISACGQTGNAQKNNTQNSNIQSNTGQNAPVAEWADGKLVIDNQTFKLSHAYATIENDPFDENEYTIRVLLSEKPISQAILDDHTALMNMKKDPNNHAMEIDIDQQRKVTWIGLWGLGQVSGLEYPFEPVVFNEKMVEGRLFTNKAETISEKKWQYDARFKSSVRVDPNKSFVTASTGKPLGAGGGEPGKAYSDYQKAIRAAKGADDLDRFYNKAVLKERNANPEMKALVLEMEKGSLLEELKIVSGFIDGDRATLSIEGKRAGESNLRGKVNLSREDGQWKIGAQAFRSGD
jgi:hypothetical protein